MKEKNRSSRAPVLPSECDYVVHKKELDGICHDYSVAVDECAKKTEELVSSKNTILIGTSVWRSSGRRSGVAVRAVDCWQ